MEYNAREPTHKAFYHVIDSGLGALNTIWAKIGFEDKLKKSRLDTAADHVKNLMEAMLTEEQSMLEKIKQNIEVYRVKLDSLCDELSVNYVKIPDNLTMMKEEHMLRTKVDNLKAEKTERMTKYNDLHTRDEELCRVLAEIPYYVPSGSVPTLQQLKELEAHVNRIQTEKDKRSAEFNDMRSKICGLYNEMEADPETSFAHNVVCDDVDNFTLSVTKMDELRSLQEELEHKNKQMTQETEDLWDRLKALWKRLETPEIDQEGFSLNKFGHGKKVVSELKAEIVACEELKLQNIQKFINGIRTELVSWWDKCFFDPQKRKAFTLYYEENLTEALLEAHEKELETVRDYFKQHKDIFERLHQREELFKTMLVFESKANDPNRFFNDRGGKLLQEEKARKKIQKDLPKLEEEVAEFISQCENKNQREFYVNGLRFPQYAIQQWEDFHRHKELEKQERMKARAKQTQVEMLYGSKSVTPGKRKVGAPSTPMRTPLKARKVHEDYSRHQQGFSIKVKVECGRTPVTTTSNRKRRSIRLMKKSATERRSSNSKRRRSRDLFSHTAVSSDSTQSNLSLASTGTYRDFSRYMSSSKTSSPESSGASESGLVRPNCRSSVAPGSLASGIRR